MIRCAALILLLQVLCAGAGAAAPVTIGETRRIHSTLLDEDREYQVDLPASYSWAKDRRYPVLIVLDGKSHFVHTAGSVGFLASQGEIPELIVVALASTVRVRDFTQTDWASHWVGGGGASNFKRFLSSELIPELDKTYRTDGFRILSGHSAGGQFVLYCLTSEPTLFNAYVALSPSLDWDDNLPQRSLEASFDATAALPVYLYVSRSDDSGRALADYDRLVETLKTKSPREFRWQSRPFPDETHASIPLLGQIDALRSLYSGYRFHPDMFDKGLPAAETHYRELSGLLGRPIAIPERVLNGLGYFALRQDRTQDAIALFVRNTEANPNSANAFDSLADAFAQAEQWRDAVRASERSVELAGRYDLPDIGYFRRQARMMKERLKQASAGDR